MASNVPRQPNRPLLPPFCEVANPNVVLEGVDGALMAFVADVARIHFDIFDKPLVITSARDGKHVPGWAHYKGKAVDVRSEDKNLEQQVVFATVLAYFCRIEGVCVYDERAQTKGPHWHLEVGVNGA